MPNIRCCSLWVWTLTFSYREETQDADLLGKFGREEQNKQKNYGFWSKIRQALAEMTIDKC